MRNIYFFECRNSPITITGMGDWRVRILRNIYRSAYILHFQYFHILLHRRTYRRTGMISHC